MKKAILTALAIVWIASPAAAADGMMNVLSAHSVQKSAERLVGILQEKGMTVFNRI